MLLHLSCCLFAVIVAHAYYKRVDSYHHIFLGLTVSSILFHTTHDVVIGRLDKCLAHISFMRVLMDTPKVFAARAEWLLIFPLSAACAWFLQSAFPKSADRLHLALHLIGVAGMNAYLHLLYRAPTPG